MAAAPGCSVQAKKEIPPFVLVTRWAAQVSWRNNYITCEEECQANPPHLRGNAAVSNYSFCSW